MRQAMLVGHISPHGASSRYRIVSIVAFCKKCCDTRLFVKLRPWPGQKWAQGRCAKCDHDQTVFPAGYQANVPGGAA